eukprot:TRINITY_DN430_c0_g1_i5.p2 TRINITY_DN430_c0_g1~~TRINITY_DN430_c0_g1_i5.p2  ORF type:complete len:101 (-),score=39.10 TRINITY_DN430_c0_g1_i5:13-315(-)
MTFFFLMIRRPPRSTQSRSSAASDVYKRQMIVSAILACAEFEVEFVRKWFHILQYYWGKALFYLFLGTVMYDNYDLFHWVTSIILLVVGIIYLIFECTQK